MTRKQLIIYLLFFSWFVYNVHRCWNNTAPLYTKPFPFDNSYEITWHWYVYMLLKDTSYLIILSAVWLYVTSNLKKDKDILGAFSAILIVQIIEIPHYLLWARHNEIVLSVEGLVLMWSAYKVMTKKY